MIDRPVSRGHGAEEPGKSQWLSPEVGGLRMERGSKPCSSVESSTSWELSSEVAPSCFSLGRKLEAARWAGGGEKLGAREMRRAGPRQRLRDGPEGGRSPSRLSDLGAFSGDTEQLWGQHSALCTLLRSNSPAHRQSEPEEAFGSLLVQLCHLQKRKPRPREEM